MTEQASLSEAVDWVMGSLLGSLATTIAILAVAAIGFLMLSGRVPARRAATTIIGCFILFSAGAIANGLVGVMTAQPVAVAEAPPPPLYTPSTPRATPFDPYAGASVPEQRAKDLFR